MIVREMGADGDRPEHGMAWKMDLALPCCCPFNLAPLPEGWLSDGLGEFAATFLCQEEDRPLNAGRGISAIGRARLVQAEDALLFGYCPRTMMDWPVCLEGLLGQHQQHFRH